MSFCGLDFGTSNSTIGVQLQGQPTMVPLETHPRTGDIETTLPSALFFNFEADNISFGRQAIQDYMQGEFGRLMRSMKSILGSNQMDEGTQIKNQVYEFNTIIGFFLNTLKQRAEDFAGQALSQIVLGRPVHFNDHDASLDKAAEQRLVDIAKQIGFTEVSFQYEPIAAAFDYEQNVTSEELALIIDIGGGTSDFTIMRLSQQSMQRSDRSADLLANHGVHIGGTDFDRHLSMATAMPYFGLGLRYKDNPTLAMPKHYFVDLATWHLIHRLYDPKVIRDLRDIRFRMQDRAPIEQLLSLLTQKNGHRLAGEVEQAKITLSQQTDSIIDLSAITESHALPTMTITQDQLNSAIEQDMQKVFGAIEDTLQMAGLKAEHIQTIFTTGGSSALPSVKQAITTRFSQAKWVGGDLFNSVGKGLLLEAIRRYR